MAILARVKAGEWTLLSSDALEFELIQTPDYRRRNRALKLLSNAWERAFIGGVETVHVQYLQTNFGLRAFDALHIACAESLHAHVFLTTDDSLLRASQRMPPRSLSFSVANPMAWLTEFLQGE